VESAYGVCNQCSKLEHQNLPSTFTFNLNLLHYSKGPAAAGAVIGLRSGTADGVGSGAGAVTGSESGAAPAAGAGGGAEWVDWVLNRKRKAAIAATAAATAASEEAARRMEQEEDRKHRATATATAAAAAAAAAPPGRVVQVDPIKPTVESA